MKLKLKSQKTFQKSSFLLLNSLIKQSNYQSSFKFSTSSLTSNQSYITKRNKKNNYDLFKTQTRNFSCCNNNSCSTSNNNNKINNDHLLDTLKKKINSLTIGDGTQLSSLNIVNNISINPENKTILIEIAIHKEYRNIANLLSKELKQESEFAAYTIKTTMAKITKKEMNENSNTNEIKKQHNTKTIKKNLQKIKKIIAVSSCKGGVGKSTVAVNLAVSLSKLTNENNEKNKIGIFDADIYGPSLPVLLKTQQKQALVYEDDKNTIIPIMFNDMKLMSYGFAAPNKKALVRGPIVSGIIQSILVNTDWGELDYLVIDFPPGTGDIQLTLCQELNITGAVIVTTPQTLAFHDVIKGIEMFDELKVPILAGVENMSYFLCGKCDTKHKIFGEGYLKMLKDQFGVEDSFEIPLEKRISVASDAGSPFILALDDNDISVSKMQFDKLAVSIQEKVYSHEYLELLNPPSVEFIEETMMIEINKDGKLLKRIRTKELRSKCGCALCIDEFTGEKVLDENKIKEDVHPKVISPHGNYAVTIVWSDGHRSSIYPYKKLLSKSICGEVLDDNIENKMSKGNTLI